MDAEATSTDRTGNARRHSSWIGASSDRRIDQRATRRSPLVRGLQFGLPLVAVALTLLVLLWPYFAPRKDFTVNFTPDSPKEEHLRMLNPRFVGRDASERDFYITADSALQDAKGSDDVRLTKLNAEVTASNGDWYTLSSATGIYNEKRQYLKVDGGFSLYTDKGHEIHGETAEADLRQSDVRSNRAVRGQGREGRISADSFRTEERGKKLFFSGNVKVVIYQKTES